MKKQFFRVKQLADQTFNRAEKSEILNQDELQTADLKIEYFRNALLAIVKKLAPSSPSNDLDKLMKKSFEYQIGHIFLEESRQQRDCHLFQTILKESGMIEHQLAREYADYELQVEELVFTPFHQVVENEMPNILKLKHNLKKYCLDKDSASNRYHATGKEAIKEDMEEADTKVEQSRDALATEMYNILSRENEFAEYILQFLKCQRIYHENCLKSLQTVIPQLEKKIGDSSVRKVFGTSLQEHLRITGKRIAYPLEICITCLSQDGMLEEGLFRVAASTIKVKRLKAAIDSGCFSYLIPEYKDVHILASLLKLYLRELPEPLLTFHLHKEWIDAAQVPESKRLEVVKNIIAKLPQENRDNLAYLFQFLSKLTKHPENKMSPSNIAIVLSPNLLWNKHENLNVNIGNCVTINILVELFIKEVDVLFPDDASKYVTIPDIFYNYEEMSNNLKSSHTNLAYVAESPKPSQRKKKSAPVPPVSLNKSGDRDNLMSKSYPEPTQSSKILEAERRHVSTETKSPNIESKGTIDRRKMSPKEQRSPQAIVKSPGVVVQTKSEHTQTLQKTPPSIPYKPETIVSAHKGTIGNKTEQSPQTQKSIVTKTDETTMTENFDRSEKISPMAVQQKANDHKFTTTAVHRIVQPSNPSVIIDNKQQIVSPLSNKSKSMSESVEDIQIRRKDPSMKPEVPARPSSLSVRPPAELDPMLRRTQCSVYNVANKQHPSIINIQNRNEIYQRGHDNQMAEKEKFLGHRAELDNTDNNLGGVNFNSSDDVRERSKSISSAKKVSVDFDDVKKLKSNEELNASTGKENNCDTNSNQKSSHTRARSDGSVIDISKGTNSSFRCISKPTEPPPPPPNQQ